MQVVCTIHQPSGDIMALFDDLLLVAGGRCCYYGEWGSAGSYFEKLGYACVPLATTHISLGHALLLAALMRLEQLCVHP